MSNKRNCVICGAEYEYCPSCKKYNHLPRWMFLFDNQNCKDIYEIINQYDAKVIDKTEAKTKLAELDITKKESFADSFRKMIDEILVDEDQAKGAKRNKAKKAADTDTDSDRDFTNNGDAI